MRRSPGWTRPWLTAGCLTTREGANTWDSFVAGPEVGTYYANLNYVVSGDWAVAIQFRRDSTHTLERADWMQEVAPERSPTP